MTLRKWDPLADLLSLQERVNRLFEQSLAGLDPDGGSAPVDGGTWVPVADAYETADAFVVELELPGVVPDTLEVRAEDSRLVVRGERRAPGPPRPERFHRVERGHGTFSRSFALAEGVDPERVTAELKDGVLRLSVAKSVGRNPRRGRGERLP
jgi:HSP20 family protein